jgi:predicted nucleic acid-binding protein
MILDTGFFIALDEGKESAIEKKDELVGSGLPQRIPSIVVQELYVSVGAGTQSFQNVEKYEKLMANYPVVSLDENIAKRAGALEGMHLVSDSKSDLGPGDAIVAATALQFNEPVVGEDSDFGDVEGLEVEQI